MALGSSISKEEKAAGVGLSQVYLNLISPPLGELIYPMQARYGWGRKERVSEPAERYGAQTGLSSWAGTTLVGEALWGLMWPQNQSLVPREWGSSIPRLSFPAPSPLSKGHFGGIL